MSEFESTVRKVQDWILQKDPDAHMLLSSTLQCALAAARVVEDSDGMNMEALRECRLALKDCVQLVEGRRLAAERAGAGHASLSDLIAARLVAADDSALGL